MFRLCLSCSKKNQAVPRELSFSQLDPDAKSTCTHTSPLSSLSACCSYLPPVCTGFHGQTITFLSLILFKCALQEKQRQQFVAQRRWGDCEDRPPNLCLLGTVPGCLRYSLRGHVRLARVERSVRSRKREAHTTTWQGSLDFGLSVTTVILPLQYIQLEQSDRATDTLQSSETQRLQKLAHL